jgi:hypothetical protein
MKKPVVCLLLLLMAPLLGGCQTPTDPDDVTTFDDAVDVTAAPNPILADIETGGRTYRVVRGNNQPDEILPYDWHASFTTTLTFNSTANSTDLDIAWPVRLAATTVAIKQASGGIVTPPTGGDSEKYEFVISAGNNTVSGINTPLSTGFEVWYDLPSLRKEAVVTVSYSFIDNDGVTFAKAEDFTIAP